MRCLFVVLEIIRKDCKFIKNELMSQCTKKMKRGILLIRDCVENRNRKKGLLC